MNKPFLACAVVLSWWLSGLASAQAPPPAPPGIAPPPGATVAVTAPEHTGLYLRLMVGGGYSQMTNTQAGSDVSIHGGGVALDMHVGYFVSPNFAIGADLFGAGIPGPTVTFNGMDMTADGSTQLDFTGIGAGATYFVPDPNIFVSASLAIARGDVQVNGQTTGRSPQGWGVHLLAGKEWWVSRHWGVGAALDFFRMTLPDSNTDDVVYGGGLLFSSSYSGG